MPAPNPDPQRIAVVGPGSVGLFFAAHLAAAGHDVVACARRPFERYRIDSPTHALDLPAAVVTDPAEITEPVPWVLVCVKAHQTEGASGWLERLCDASTGVLVVQNGIEHDRVVPFVNGARVLPTVVYCGAELKEPGHVVHHASAHLIAPTGPLADEAAALFEGCQAELRRRDDHLDQMWLKLSLNVMANSLTALTRRDLSVFREPAIQQVAKRLLREVWSVARAEGASLDDAMADRIVEGSANREAPGGTSMYYDTMAGRPTEHDAITGAALRAARRHEIDVPMVEFAHALLDTRA